MSYNAVFNTSCDLKKISSRSLSRDDDKKHVTILGVEIVYLYLIGIGTAFIGWVAENAVKLVSSGVIDCRFHVLPFISPYALIPLAMHVMLGDPDDVAPFGLHIFKRKTALSVVLSNIICVGIICITVFAGEFVIGNSWEKLFNVRLWDYSAQPLHLTQYVSVFSALGYGIGAYLLFRFAIRPTLTRARKYVGYGVARSVCSTLGLWIVTDTVFMCLQIIFGGSAPMYWSLSF